MNCQWWLIEKKCVTRSRIVYYLPWRIQRRISRYVQWVTVIRLRLRIRNNHDGNRLGDFRDENHACLIFVGLVALRVCGRISPGNVISNECWPWPLNWYSVNRCQKHTRYCLNGLVSPSASKVRGVASCPRRKRSSIECEQTGRPFVEDNAGSLRSFNIFRQQAARAHLVIKSVWSANIGNLGACGLDSTTLARAIRRYSAREKCPFLKKGFRDNCSRRTRAISHD